MCHILDLPTESQICIINFLIFKGYASISARSFAQVNTYFNTLMKYTKDYRVICEFHTGCKYYLNDNIRLAAITGNLLIIKFYMTVILKMYKCIESVWYNAFIEACMANHIICAKYMLEYPDFLIKENLRLYLYNPYLTKIYKVADRNFLNT